MPAARYLPVDARLSGLFWNRFKTYDFAHDLTGSVIHASEAIRIASFAPFAFVRVKQGFLPYALYAFTGTKNVFVSPNGKWRGSYVPANLRGYPFAMIGRTDAGVFSVREDAVLHTKTASSLPFLDYAGQLSAPVQDVQGFLQACQTEMHSTTSILNKVARRGLLVRPKSELFATQGLNRLFVVDWQAISADRAAAKAMSDDIVLQRILHAHAVSLNHLDRVRALEAGVLDFGQKASIRQHGIEGFLDAVGGSLHSQQ